MARQIQALLPYFGGNRSNGPTIGHLLRDCRWVGVPFAGGMSELLHITAPTIVCGDLHRNVVNLALTVKHEREWLQSQAAAIAFHPDSLAAAQASVKQADAAGVLAKVGPACYVRNIALNYFVSQWMGRSGKSGTDNELAGALPIRWNANGGDSNTRYRSAVEALTGFESVMVRCNFFVEDCFQFLDKVSDSADSGIYCDAPWPEAGAKYKHKVDDETFHAALRDRLEQFEQTRIVVRYGACDLIRDLYSGRNGWSEINVESRTQSGSGLTECLFVRED